MTSTIRAARPRDADALSRLAHASKAHWGYDAAFLEAASADLNVSPAFIEKHDVFLMEDPDGAVLGFYGLMPTPEAFSVEHLFVAPGAIGTGVGARLFAHLVETARGRGATRIHIGSDPNAEGFYVKQGARRIGTTPSIIPNRVLPLLELVLA